jgi:hypothetical protein
VRVSCASSPQPLSQHLDAHTRLQVYLAADDKGGVVSHAWPGAELPPRPGFAALAPPPQTYGMHSAVGGGITRMALVASRGLLFTAR